MILTKIYDNQHVLKGYTTKIIIITLSIKRNKNVFNLFNGYRLINSFDKLLKSSNNHLYIFICLPFPVYN